ncbi:MAG: hypothetical protein OEZ40_11680 [Candidatus Bathyarchaeota archaeon]|nr:hypothetical protein [Candidatus Bathyarchaeota archaeon]
MKRRKMKMIEMCFLALFVVVLVSAVLFATFFNMPLVSLALLLVDFPVAGITAIYASLSIREEEEEKTQAST